MICIVIVNYNGKSDTEECIKSIKQNNADYKIIIVDNGSERDKVIYNDVVDEEYCKIIYLDENVGFAAGNNVGMDYALKFNPNYVMLLNNDTVIGIDCLSNLERKAKEYNDQVVLTTKIVYYDDQNYIWYGGCRYDKENGEYKILGLRDTDKEKYNKETYVEYITGCVMFIPIAIMKAVGKMSEDYFLYYEDADYCQKIRSHGLKMAYIPSITINHKESRSTKRGSNLYHYYILRNYLIYISKFSEHKYYYITRRVLQSLKDVAGRRIRLKVWIYALHDFASKKYGKAEARKVS